MRVNWSRAAWAGLLGTGVDGLQPLGRPEHGNCHDPPAMLAGRWVEVQCSAGPVIDDRNHSVLTCASRLPEPPFSGRGASGSPVAHAQLVYLDEDLLFSGSAVLATGSLRPPGLRRRSGHAGAPTPAIGPARPEATACEDRAAQSPVGAGDAPPESPFPLHLGAGGRRPAGRRPSGLAQPTLLGRPY
jgi:hypothetical protein